MGRRETWMGLALGALVACSSSEAPEPQADKLKQRAEMLKPRAQAASEEPAFEEPTAFPAPQENLRVIPAAQADWDTMWGPLKEDPRVYRPLSSSSAEAMSAKLAEGGSFDAAELELSFLALAAPPNPSQGAYALYTDTKLLKPETQSIEFDAVEALRDVFGTPGIFGAGFNPHSSYSSQEVFGYWIDKLYTARLIGYLIADPTPTGQNYLAAIQAESQGKYFECIFYALRSYDEGEPWEKAELAKLRAMSGLEDPAVLELAVSELEWFLEKYGDTSEGQKLLETLQAK